MEARYRLGVSTDWLKHWGVPKGVQELVQNFYDQVLKGSKKVHPRNLQLIQMVTAENWDIFEVTPPQQKILGYIIYDKSRKLFALVNKDTFLPVGALTVGYSAKSASDKAKYAGKHGEGLKAAVAALLRENKTFQIHQSGYTMRFDCDEDRLIHVNIEASRNDKMISDFLCHLEKEFKIDRNEDVIQVIKGLDEQYKNVAMRKFLRYTHLEVENFEGHKTNKEYCRLSTKDGDILWQETNKKGCLQGRVYVSGILWDLVDEQKNYGVDLKSNTLNNRDRDSVGFNQYSELISKVVNSALMKYNQTQYDPFAKVIVKELHEAHEVNALTHPSPECAL